jgi:hypothetical protein
MENITTKDMGKSFKKAKNSSSLIGDHSFEITLKFNNATKGLNMSPYSAFV